MNEEMTKNIEVCKVTYKVGDDFVYSQDAKLGMLVVRKDGSIAEIMLIIEGGGETMSEEQTEEPQEESEEEVKDTEDTEVEGGKDNE